MNLSLGLHRLPLIRGSNRLVCEVRSVHDVTDTSVIPNIIIFFSGASSRPKRALASGPEHPPGMLILLPRRDEAVGQRNATSVCMTSEIPRFMSVEDRPWFTVPLAWVWRGPKIWEWGTKYYPNLHINMLPSPHGIPFYPLSHCVHPPRVASDLASSLICL